ncbi:MAG: HAD hydrolase family protein [Weeksellaceae bacterium]|nr:HAD hydrolase family protein [Weeksellaceae bacterium]
MMNYKTKLKNIEAIFLDVDGVLTNGQVLLDSYGNLLRSMHVKDGFVLQYAVKKGLKVVIISGGRDQQVTKRLAGLGITDVHLDVQSKLPVLKEYIEENGLSAENVLYMGDDMPDIPCMQYVGLACCPVDAVAEVRAVAEYVSPAAGGLGCVRDIVEQLLKVQGKWQFDFEIVRRPV